MAAAAVAVLAAVAMPGTAGAHPAHPAPGPSWQRYVVAPASRDVRPVRVLGTAGAVTDPRGVLGRGTTTLTRSAPLPLTIAAPGDVTLPGITVLSNSDGAPQDFTVQTWDGVAWQTAATVTGNDQVPRARYGSP
jgi:hypothetical protein